MKGEICSKKVSVSFFDSKNIEDDLINLCDTECDYIHVDVGDGIFIKRKFNPIKDLRNISDAMTKRLDVHLMCDNPTKFIHEYGELNCEYITIHCEIKRDLLNMIELIKSYGIKPGLAISPDTDISFLEPFIDDVDIILVMGVEPGLGGQKFIYDTIDKIKEIKKIVGKRNVLISVDGGVNSEISKLIDCDMVVSGNFVLTSKDISSSIKMLR